MTATSARLSIRSLFLWVIMAIATITLVLATGLSLYLQISSYREDLEETVVMLANIISENAAQDIASGDEQSTMRHLSSAAQAEIVAHVHAYWYNPNRSDDLSFLSSYHKPGEPPIQDQSRRIHLLKTPSMGDGTVEVARPVTYNDNYVGYIYLSASAAKFNSLVGQAILLNLGVMFVMMILTLILALRLQSVIVGPIESMADFLQRTARLRDYSARTPTSSINELNILTDAVNVLLARMQDYVQKQHEAEEQHRQLNASLEDIVSQRTVALKEANQELIQTLEKLHQYQRQIVENEKMASLGDMVAGVAHEVNTPIGLGVTASTMMLDQIGDIQKDFENRTLKASALDRFLSDSQENLNIIYRNLNRAAELISSFKQVAVDQTTESSRTFCVSQLINEILLSLRPQLKKHQHKINVHCDPTLHVETKAGPINQILINLIVNSVVHGFEDTESGTIDITADLMTTSTLKLVYKDNGKGIPDEIRKRIFAPFVTTRRGQGGSGLGMHLVYNLVTQGLNGSITLSSEEGKGVEFLIVFPVETATAGNENE
ncbi:HAMP domain-containing histidine kinase [Salinimonas sp. HHU 13199]|uniref:histidine kinase n=1 Tax=Salinimonas profundi TaxID=2729140 RepID=A0ABR8LMB7_9ALTE|nr:sensor histidine kinase [Salinimonas profundi]MBD3586440.1 HAMP domain-containing histidine kinase [Salinimonas profundi]